MNMGITIAMTGRAIIQNLSSIQATSVYNPPMATAVQEMRNDREAGNAHHVRMIMMDRPHVVEVHTLCIKKVLPFSIMWSAYNE